jgi:hypothetical protein
VPALITSGGAPATWPAWAPRAISFTLPDGTAFALPRNPTAFDDQQPLVAVDRATADGILTNVWQPDVQTVVLSGFTREEGTGPWYQFRAQFQGKTCAYRNALTGQPSQTVLVDSVRIRNTGKPATFTWEITIKQAVQG